MKIDASASPSVTTVKFRYGDFGVVTATGVDTPSTDPATDIT